MLLRDAWPGGRAELGHGWHHAEHYGRSLACGSRCHRYSQKRGQLARRICACSLLLPSAMPKAFFCFALNQWPCWGKDGSGDTAPCGQPHAPGTSHAVPNLTEHFPKAAPLSSAALTDQALSWLGLEVAPWTSWGGTTTPMVEIIVPAHIGTTPGSTTTATTFPVTDGGSTWGCRSRCPSKQESTVQ